MYFIGRICSRYIIKNIDKLKKKLINKKKTGYSIWTNKNLFHKIWHSFVMFPILLNLIVFFFLNKALKIYLPICTISNINTPFHNKKSVYNSLTSTTTNYYFYILLLLLLPPSNLYTKLRLILTKKIFEFNW